MRSIAYNGKRMILDGTEKCIVRWDPRSEAREGVRRKGNPLPRAPIARGSKKKWKPSSSRAYRAPA